MLNSRTAEPSGRGLRRCFAEAHFLELRVRISMGVSRLFLVNVVCCRNSLRRGGHSNVLCLSLVAETRRRDLGSYDVDPWESNLFV
jgi:hypothetical protein